jgi:signal transduction histidine kinase
LQIFLDSTYCACYNLYEDFPTMPQSFFEQIFTLLTTNPGNLAYHLVLAFSIAGVLSFSLISWGRSPEANRMILGMGLLLALRMTLFIVAALSWQNIILVAQIMPPLDRAVTLLSLIIILWLWAFSNPQKSGDAASLLLGLLVSTLSIMATIWWVQQRTGIPFNGSWLDRISAGLGVILCLIGMIILVINRRENWGTGFGMFGLLLVGQAVHYFAPLPVGDFSGAIRLSQMAAFPLLFALAQQVRYGAPVLQHSSETNNKSGKIQQNSADDYLQPFLEVASADSKEALAVSLARLVSKMMSADICLVVELPSQAQQLLVSSGYNRIKQQEIQPFSVNSQLGYTIRNALRQRPVLRLPASSTAGDELGVSLSLSGNRLGHLLAAPLPLENNPVLTGLILLTPYARHGWSSFDEDKFINLLKQLAHFLQQTQEWRQTPQAVTEREGLLHQMEQIHRENEILLSELEEARQQASHEHTRAESLAALLASDEEYPQVFNKAEAVIIHAKETASSQETERLQVELHLALEEIAHLKNSLSVIEMKLLEQQLTKSGSGEEKLIGTAASVAHDLRQPLSSITEYIEALISEGKNNLDNNQHKYLERIKASVGRMGGMVEDLLQASLDPNSPAVEAGAEISDVIAVVDEAVALIMGQMREKNIILRVNIPQNLPAVKFQREALQQTIIHLLQNASSVTPEEGIISFQAKIHSQGEQLNRVLLRISDSGGGIPEEALPRVFSRLQQSKEVIPGLGDSALRLSAAKSLVEAQGGQIWVETELQKGTTFNVLLPSVQKKTSSNGHGAMAE